MKSITELYNKLGISPPKRKYTYTMVNQKEIPAWLYRHEQAKWKISVKEFKKKLNKYRTGSRKEWEGDGYFVKPVYTHEGVQYS
jgi:hypothetical protein